jgi:hypothetical protein
VVLTTCTKTPSPKHFDQLKVSYKKVNGQVVQRQIPILSAVVDSNTSYYIDTINSSHPYRFHQLCLANYDLSPGTVKSDSGTIKDLRDQDLNPLEVCINVNDQEGANPSSPFQPGTHFIGITQDQPDRVSAVFIYLDPGKRNYVPFRLKSMTGFLRVDSVLDDVIIGEISLSDGDNSLAGTFNLKPRIIKWVTSL